MREIAIISFERNQKLFVVRNVISFLDLRQSLLVAYIILDGCTE